jgi:Cdc6-like AAA superfamily ATPase
MEKRLRTWFHLKDEFSSFKLIPQEHARYLFGDKDKTLRNDLLTSLRECSYSERGYHAIIWGPSGRGKTHLANNLCFSAKEENMSLEIVYADCPTIRSAKEPVKTFFGSILRSMPPQMVKRFVTAYVSKVKVDSTIDWEKRVLADLNNDKSIYTAMCDGLVLPNENTIRGILGWLGGESYNISDISQQAPKQIESGEQIARNIGALGSMLLLAENKNLIFLVDEAERLQTIQSGEPYWIWLSSLRELFRRPSVGMIMFVIAEGIDYIPTILAGENEIRNRIGENNIMSSPSFGPPDAESFLKQLLETMIKRSPIPSTLQKVLDETGESIEYYPFTRDAFEEFIQHHSIGTMESKPQEVLNNLERAAQRAISLDKMLIDRQVLEQVIHGL